MRTNLWMAALVATLASTGVANAAEPVSWAGWHAGIFGSYVSGKLNSNDESHFTSTGDFNDDGPMAGVYGGLRRQRDSGVVLGADLEVPLYMEKGTAVDKQYFPGLAKYEAIYKYAFFLSGHVGLARGKALPYLSAAAGFMNVDGRTLNIDLNDQYSPGFVQSAAATHFVWQGGAGVDYQVSPKMIAGARITAFIGSRADHTMSWNSPGPNLFGYKAAVLQVNLGRRF